MTTVGAVMSRLDGIAPMAKAGGWDPVGLQLGDPEASVTTVGVCHEVTVPVVDAAFTAGVDLLVSYHPLLFRPTTRIVAGPGAGGRALKLLTHGISLAIVHTAYDAAVGGVADALAESLGLGSAIPFGPNWGAATVKVVTFAPPAAVEAVSAAMTAAGAGTIGGYTACSFRSPGEGAFTAPHGTRPSAGIAGAANIESEVRIEMSAPTRLQEAVVAALVGAHPYEEPAFDVYDVRANAGFIGRVGDLPAAARLGDFAEMVADVLGAQPRVAGDRALPVRHVAVVPGSGSSFLSHASGADVVVTGDVGHHDARTAMERSVAVVDPGHAASERPGVAKLYAAVAHIVDNAVDLTGVDADPWNHDGGQ